MIVPNAAFNCNGRITNVAVSMQRIFFRGSNFPLFQVWHPTSINSNSYSIIGEVQLPNGNAIDSFFGPYLANVSLDSNSQIEFQSGDVIGYYQPSYSRRRIWSIQTSGYTSYSNNVTSPSTTFDINNVYNTETDRQPLINIMFGRL